MLTIGSRIKYVKKIDVTAYNLANRITLVKVYTINKIENGKYYFIDDLNTSLSVSHKDMNIVTFHFKDITRLEKLNKIKNCVQHQR